MGYLMVVFLLSLRHSPPSYNVHTECQLSGLYAAACEEHWMMCDTSSWQ